MKNGEENRAAHNDDECGALWEGALAAVPRANAFLMAPPQALHSEIQGLLACNGFTACYGLTLGEQQISRLMQRRVDALRETGRVEFGKGVLRELIEAFCDSPYLDQGCYEQTLADLQDIFYYFKGEAMEGLSDEELIAHMKANFDGECQGSLEALAGRSLEQLCKSVREKGGPTW